jgi:TRAP-type C4-dicarboxylate transport system permease small subunit
MDKLIGQVCKVFESLIALCLAVMVVLVFGNVVLRYGFDSSIAMSEEVSRWLFVWVTFLGAVVALYRHEHLGVDMVVDRLPVLGRKICLVLGHGVMLGVAWLLFSGSWEQVMLNIEVGAPTTGAPMAILYAPGVVFAVLATAILLLNLGRALSGRLKASELVMVQASEETVQMEQILGAVAEEQAAGVSDGSRA